MAKATPKKKRPSKADVKAAAARAESRSKGEKISAPKVPIDPVITKAADDPKAETKMGRPTDYKPEYVEQVQKLCALGATDEEIAHFFGVTVRTMYRWKVAHADFCQAAIVGKGPADDRVVRSAFQMATGHYVIEQVAIKIKTGKDTEEVRIVEVEKYVPPQPTAAMFWLKNRRKDEWRDRHEHAFGTPSEFAAMDDGELAQFIQEEAAAIAGALGGEAGKSVLCRSTTVKGSGSTH